jgi:hypothetical protein
MRTESASSSVEESGHVLTKSHYEFGLSLCKIVRSSVILLLPLLQVHSNIFYESIILINIYYGFSLLHKCSLVFGT